MTVVCKLKPEEWKEYKKIRLEALKKDPSAFGAKYSEESKRKSSEWKERLKRGKNPWLLFAKDGKNIAGMIAAYNSKENKNLASINAVYVSQKFRGKGIGTFLLNEIIKTLSLEKEISKLQLHVNINQTAAIKLYERGRFKTVGKEKGIIGDRKDHLVYVMEKELR